MEDILELPFGIISSTQEGENFADDIPKGFTVYKNNKSFILNANLCDQELTQTYYDLLEEYKKFTVFWYNIHDYCEESEKSEIYTNENLDSSSKIIDYLRACPHLSLIQINVHAKKSMALKLRASFS